MVPVGLILRPIVREDVDEEMPIERQRPAVHAVRRLIIDELTRLDSHLMLLTGVVIDFERPWGAHAPLVDIYDERECVGRHSIDVR